MAAISELAEVGSGRERSEKRSFLVGWVIEMCFYELSGKIQHAKREKDLPRGRM